MHLVMRLLVVFNHGSHLVVVYICVMVGTLVVAIYMIDWLAIVIRLVMVFCRDWNLVLAHFVDHRLSILMNHAVFNWLFIFVDNVMNGMLMLPHNMVNCWLFILVHYTTMNWCLMNNFVNGFFMHYSVDRFLMNHAIHRLLVDYVTHWLLMYYSVDRLLVDDSVNNWLFMDDSVNNWLFMDDSVNNWLFMDYTMNNWLLLTYDTVDRFLVVLYFMMFDNMLMVMHWLNNSQVLMMVFIMMNWLYDSQVLVMVVIVITLLITLVVIMMRDFMFMDLHGCQVMFAAQVLDFEIVSR